MRYFNGVVGGMAACLFVVGAAAVPATADSLPGVRSQERSAHAFQQNPNPIDWAVRSTFQGPGGEDVPLRVGQHDAGPLSGFGERHILQRHGEVPDYGHMQQALDGCPTPEPTPDGTIQCQFQFNPTDGIRVVISESVSGTPDGRPRGVITAFYTYDVQSPSDLNVHG